MASLTDSQPWQDRRRPESRASADFEAKRQDLVARQREERSDLEDVLAKRRNRELIDRQSRLPRGLKLAWMRLTGGLDRIERALAEATARCDRRDRGEMQAMIDRHLAERRQLDIERDQGLDFDELKAQFENLTARPLYAPDLRQSLELAPDDPPLDPVDLLSRPEIILERLSYRMPGWSSR